MYDPVTVPQADPGEDDPSGRPRVMRLRVAVAVVATAAAVGAIILGALALSGASGSDGQPEAAATLPPSPAAEPTVAPGPARFDPRASWFDVQCEDLVTPAELAALGITTEAVRGGAAPIGGLMEAAFIAMGALECQWADAGTTLDVVLLADPDGRLADQEISEDPNDIAPVCFRSHCYGVLSSNGVATSVGLSREGVEFEGYRGVAVSIAERAAMLTAAPPSGWTEPPVVRFTPDNWNSDERVADVAVAFGLGGVSAGGEDVDPMSGLVLHRAGYVTGLYALESGDWFWMDVLPGAEWAAAELAARPEARPVQVDGARHSAVISHYGIPAVCFEAGNAAFCVGGLDEAALVTGARGIAVLVAND